MEQPQGDDEEDDEVIDDEALQNDGPDEDIFFEEPSRLDASLDNSTQHIITATIDPIEWKTELERVTPKLKANITVATNEWRSHVDQTVTSKSLIEKVMSASQGELQIINKSVAEELNQMKMKEKYINNQYSSLGLEFAEVRAPIRLTLACLSFICLLSHIVC